MAEKENNTQAEPDVTETAAENSPAAEYEKKAKHTRSKKGGDEIEKLRAKAQEEVAKAEEKAAELNEKLLRTAAEYDNHRKRSQKETESAFSNGVAFSAQELLPVLDTLDCAAKTETADEEYKKGVLMTLSKCEEVFKKLGITEIDAMGQPFDPELHNAVLQEAVDGAESGTITQVMQKGYMLKGKVIRHAMVAVAP